ncbi:MAG: hypothetical protein QM808_09585 [Steroidobacteraceae bacterium]
MDQSQDNLGHVSPSAVHLCGKAWTAYVGISVRLLLLLVLCIGAIYWQPSYWQILSLILVIGLVFIGYQVLLIRSYRLYYDDTGVWIFSGVLPWKRGVAGVKWRDLDEATFSNDFWSWASRSYTIQLKHRFTKAVEIAESNMANGKQVVIALNQQHQQRINKAESMQSYQSN